MRGVEACGMSWVRLDQPEVEPYWACDPDACCGRVADPARGPGQAGPRRGRGVPDRAGPGRAGPYIYRDIPRSGWVGQRNTGQED